MEMILEEQTCELVRDSDQSQWLQNDFGYLIALDAEGLFEHVFRIDNHAQIGRSHDCQIRVRRKDVSRQHAKIWCDTDGWFLKDLESTNGTQVNQQTIQSQKLKSRDDIQVAGNAFRFLVAAEPELTYHRAVELIASTDSLTSLHNRDFMKRKTFDALCNHQPPAFMIVDIDRFKEINDTCGHLVGDEILMQVGQRIQVACGDSAVVGRISGDEFAVLVAEPHLLDLQQYSDSICQAVAATPIMTTARPLITTVSVGTAVATSATRTISGIMAAADRELYNAKLSGRNCASVAKIED